MNITLFLMTEKGYEVLKSLCETDFIKSVSAVIGSRDENIQEDFYFSIKDLCEKNNIIFHDRKDNYQINSDYCLAISWRWLIDNSKSRLIVLHDSLLPKYRGFAPLVNMLINEEKHIGVTALYATSEFDRGDIILQKKIEVSYPIKIKTAIEKVSKLYVDIVLEILTLLHCNKPLPCSKQDDSLASYSLWRDEEDYHINWNQSSELVQRFIDSVGYPYKGAFSILDNDKVRIFDSEVIPDVNIENRTPGKVLFFDKSNPVVVCGTGLLKVTELKSDEKNEKYQLKKFRIKFK